MASILDLLKNSDPKTLQKLEDNGMIPQGTSSKIYGPQQATTDGLQQIPTDIQPDNSQSQSSGTNDFLSTLGVGLSGIGDAFNASAGRQTNFGKQALDIQQNNRMMQMQQMQKLQKDTAARKIYEQMTGQKADPNMTADVLEGMSPTLGRFISANAKSETTPGIYLMDPKTGKITFGGKEIPPESIPNNAKIEKLQTGTLKSPEEEAQAIRIAKASGEGRAQAYGEIRPISVYDTSTGEIKTMNMNDFNSYNKLEPNRYVEQGKAAPALNKQGLFNDIRGSLEKTKQSLEALPRDFTTTENAQFAKVLQAPDPRSALGTFLQSQIGSTLNSKQIDYITDVVQLREQMMGMRNVLGAGQGSDLARQAIEATIPSGSTPNREFARTQLKKAEATIGRLEPYIGKIKIPNSLNNNQNQQSNLSPKDQEAIQWAKSNPNDPRASKILQIHGVQ